MKAAEERDTPSVPCVDTESHFQYTQPTFAESGYPDLVGEGWMGLYAPPQTPLPITSALSAEVSAILALPDVRDRIITTGMEPRASTPAGLAEFDNVEFKKWQPIVAASGFKVE
jgi:tripartite-type tricarboxylate transporter receptor subunit TctC